MNAVAIRQMTQAHPLLKLTLRVPLASRPPEARGLRRDGVRLMLSHYRDEDPVTAVGHHVFQDLPGLLNPGDLLVINTSATLPAAFDATAPDGHALRVHLSTRRSEQPGFSEWIVELRTPSRNGASTPYARVEAGEMLSLPGGGALHVLAPYPELSAQVRLPGQEAAAQRLWRAHLHTAEPWLDWLRQHGRAIRYGYVEQDWPLDAYQSVYASVPGSAEMPSAGRAFTPELITALVAAGIQVLPLVLHTGVSSPEAHEPPYAEYFELPEVTAAAVNAARAAGRRVIAVGTTVVRALESAVDSQGRVAAGTGWTGLVITPARGLKVVDGLLTGLHEPEASHLDMLAALAGHAHLNLAYADAIARKYLWHEFGDLHLILP